MSGKCGLEFCFGVVRWLFLVYFLTHFHVCAPDCSGKFKTVEDQEHCLLFALLLPTALSTLHTVGAPELSLAGGCNEKLQQPHEPIDHRVV